jgi:YesN/AraC family two-component response regulator
MHEGMTKRKDSILIVDDDRVVRELMTLALGDTYEVRQAATGGEAIAILHREPVAAVVLDYRLPDRTGFEVLSEIECVQPRVPVIMITGYGSEFICASAFKLGARDYFPKPIDVYELGRSVGRVLSQSLSVLGGTEKGRDQASAFPGGSARRRDVQIEKAVQLIRHQYWDRVSLGRLAREIGMSKFRLSHRFTQVMGISLRAYLLMVRLERGKELLTTGDASITEVAQAVGFADLPRFDKLFKRYTGLTPSAYRSLGLARNK